jgi:peptidyl-prolyl cis-trans isomerase C
MTLIPSAMHRRFLILTAFALLAACAKPQKPAVVATVDGEAIGAEELSAAVAEHSDDYGADVLADREGREVVKKTVLNGIIQEKVLLQTAREKGVALTTEEEKALNDGMRSGYGPGELEKILKGKGLSLEEWTRRQRNKRLIDKLIDQEVLTPLAPSDQEIEDYYKRNRAAFRLPDRVRCRHIVTDKRDKAEKILSLLEKGENFASVAQKYSESPERESGGDLGYVARGQFPAVFESACFSLGTGQTSDVIASEYGFHIFRVTDKQPGRQQTLKEASDDIARQLTAEKAQGALKDWLDALYRNKKITIDEKALKGVSVGAQL